MPRRKTSKKAPLAAFPNHLSDMLSRIRFDFHRALAIDDGAAFVRAALECRDCGRRAACVDWNVAHEEGAGSPPPHFCKLGPFLKLAEPKRARPAKPKPVRKLTVKRKR